MKRLTALLLVSLVVSRAATYYIDYEGGSDANNGTSTNLAWKHSPYMRAFTGTYTKIECDDFIFKGGVTWPKQCFQYRITKGGTPSNRSYHGVDHNWFTGEFWTYPVFDFEDTPVTNYTGTAQGNQKAAGFLLDAYGSGNPVNNVTIDGIELKRHRAVHGTNEAMGVYGSYTLVLNGGAVTNCVLTNLYIHDWDISEIGNTNFNYVFEDNGGGILMVNADSGVGAQANLIVTGCTFDQILAVQKVGVAIKNFYGTVTNCIFRDLTCIFIGSGNIRNNWANGCGYNGTDADGHENSWFINNYETRFEGNYVTNSYAQGVYLAIGWTATPETPLCDTNTGARIVEVFNNVIESRGFAGAIEIDPGGYAEKVGARIYYNTLYRNVEPVIQWDGPSRQQWINYVEASNNLLISPEGTEAANGISQSYVSNSIVVISNIIMTTTAAADAGFIRANQWAPTSTNNVAYRTGTMNLSGNPYWCSRDYLHTLRTWPSDIGAYQYFPSISTQRVVRANRVVGRRP